MSFGLPNTAGEFLFLVIPGLTFLLGLGFLLIPRRIFRFMGLEPVKGHPEAIGEGRSSFAGFMLAIGAACILMQDPIALQPGLNFALALAWTIAVFGRILQMLLDNGLRRKRVQVRLILAIGMMLGAWAIVDSYYFGCSEFGSPLCEFPSGQAGWQSWFMVFLGLLTTLLGLIALFLPLTALKILRLKTHDKTPFARGETRGTLAGFYCAIGLTFLFAPMMPPFMAIVLGAGWLFTGIGRFLSILFDRGWTAYNIVGTIFELSVGALALAITFQIL